MPAFGFKSRLARLVEAGTKRQTIRAERVDCAPPCRFGQWVTCWEDLRTRECRKINAGPCTAARRIEIGKAPLAQIRIDDRPLNDAEAEALARADGFTGLETGFGLLAFFDVEHGLPFQGWIVEWEPMGKDALPPGFVGQPSVPLLDGPWVPATGVDEEGVLVAPTAGGSTPTVCVVGDPHEPFRIDTHGPLMALIKAAPSLRQACLALLAIAPSNLDECREDDPALWAAYQMAKAAVTCIDTTPRRKGSGHGRA